MASTWSIWLGHIEPDSNRLLVIRYLRCIYRCTLTWHLFRRLVLPLCYHISILLSNYSFMVGELPSFYGLMRTRRTVVLSLVWSEKRLLIFERSYYLYPVRCNGRKKVSNICGKQWRKWYMFIYIWSFC
jgi:hypothetical protein